MTAFTHKMALAVVSAVLGMALLAGCSAPERLLVLAFLTLGVQSEGSLPGPPTVVDVPPGSADDGSGQSATSPGTGGPTTAAVPPTSLPEGVLATYRRSGCFEGVDDFLTVYEDGRLTLTRRTGETYEATATGSELSGLAGQLAGAAFARLDAYYPATGADLCVYEISTAIDGKPRLVTSMDGAAAPRALLELIDTLERLRQRTAETDVSAPPPAAVSAAYGAKVRYQQGRPLNFPDLTLESRGELQADAGQRYPRGFVYHDFRARQGAETQDVSWSAGTGDIGPTVFELGGRAYRLELRQSDELGRLADDELVLWQE